jgi:hypothetical protein
MALVKCRECGHQISTQAISCPSCGAKAKKKTHWFTWLVVAFIGGTVILAVVDKPPERAAAKAPAPPVSAASAAESAKREANFQKQVFHARALAAVVRQAARDPESVVFEFIGASDDGSVVCATYRAKNGFGGMNRETAVAVGGKAYAGQPALWAKHCANKSMIDLTRVI